MKINGLGGYPQPAKTVTLSRSVHLYAVTMHLISMVYHGLNCLKCALCSFAPQYPHQGDLLPRDGHGVLVRGRRLLFLVKHRQGPRKRYRGCWNDLDGISNWS